MIFDWLIDLLAITGIEEALKTRTGKFALLIFLGVLAALLIWLVSH